MIGVSVHIAIYIYIYLCIATCICLWTKNILNLTLAIDSPFQTFAVGLLVEFID